MRVAALLLAVGCSFETSAEAPDPGGFAGDRPDATAPASPEPLHLRVSVLIDGRSRLILSGSQLEWYHLDYSAPGRHDHQTLPTLVDGLEWWPTWPDQPDSENRDCGCRSLDAWSGLTVPVPEVATTATVTPVGEMRGVAQVIEQATVANDFAVVVELDDNQTAGATTYVLDIDVVAADI